MDTNFRELAHAGYEAYSASTGNKNFRGEEMPAFDALPEPIINAWIAATKEIVDVFARAVTA